MTKGTAAVENRGSRVAARLSERRRRVSDESGQVLTVVAVATVLMICCVGLVVDVGHAMLVQRQLQAGVDAGALAGVQHLPDAGMAESVAVQYSATPGSKNAVNTVNNAITTAKVSCLAGVPGCNRRDGGVNGITVVSKSDVPTWFGRIIGIDKMSVSAKSVACAPCAVKPLDIMIVLDRTGSMCAPVSCDDAGNNFSDLRFAQDGVETFLGYLDPSLDKVGLAVFPPSLNASHVDDCPNRPTANPQFYGYDQWWSPDGTRKPPGGPTSAESSFHVLASLEGADGNLTNDYLVQDTNGDWVLNRPPYMPTGNNSTLLLRLGCVRGAGSTSYANSIEEAKHELTAHGRGSAQDIIIFLSDGGANTTQLDVPAGHHTITGGHEQQPCGNGVRSASLAKGSGTPPSTIIYTIGYDLAAGGGTPEPCRRPDPVTGHQNNGMGIETGCGVTPTGWGHPIDGCTSKAALTAMATSPLHFYNKPTSGQLNDIFRAIALDISGSRGRLIDATSPLLP